jgi:Na+/proline symporter
MLAPFEAIRLVMWRLMADVNDDVGLCTHSEVSEQDPERVGGRTILSISGKAGSGVALFAISAAVLSTRLTHASANRAALSTIQPDPGSSPAAGANGKKSS